MASNPIFDVYNAIDNYFFNYFEIDEIPEILKDKSWEFLIKATLRYYSNNPTYWSELGKIDRVKPLQYMTAEEMLKYCKIIILENNITKNQKLYVKDARTKEEKTQAELFREFSKTVDKITNYYYSEDDKRFLYNVILTDEEKAKLIPSFTKKMELTKSKKKVEEMKNAFIENKGKTIVFLSNNDQISDKVLAALFKPHKVYLLQLETKPELILKLNPDLIIGIGKDSFKYLSDDIKKMSGRMYQYKHDETKVIMTIPEKINEQHVENIKDFLKSAINAKAIMNSNIIDMSTKAKSKLKTLNHWEDVVDLVKKGYKIVTTQTFYNEYEFKKPLAVISFETPDGDREYYNANNLDYVYYICNREVDVNKGIGIEPLEDLKELEKCSMTIEDHMTNRYRILKDIPLPRLFEADIPTADKMMQFSKEYCEPHFDDVNQIISTDPKIAYLDIEVYMDEGFEQPENARKEVNAFAYSFHDSTHVDIYLLSDTPLEKQYELIDKYLKDAKQSVIKAKEQGLKIPDSVIERIENYTYEIHTVDSEYKLIKALDDLIKIDRPDVLTAWNIWFDINYLINRCKLKGYDDISFSPVGIRGYISSQNALYSAPGIDFIDMLEGWKASIKGSPPSAKLNYAGTIELGIAKIEYDGDLCQLYDTDKVKYAGYNQFDTIIMKEINLKKQILVQRMFYKQVTGCSVGSTDSTIKSVDTVSIPFARQKNLAIRNHTRMVKKDKAYAGALTIARQPGIHLLVTDLDQTSQYPSMMQTFNLSADTLKLIIDVEYEILYKYIHENKLSQADANREIIVTKNPLTWYGGDRLGVEFKLKLKDVLKFIKDQNWILTVTGAVFLNHTQKVGFYFDLLKTFRDFRNEFKAQMKQAHQAGDLNGKMVFNNLQLAMKVLINSVYGCTGTDSYRFFHVAISETITTMARTEISIVSTNLENLILEWEQNLENDILKIIEQGA